jgi:hypothetical protein
MDENDKHRAGALPADPEAGAVSMGSTPLDEHAPALDTLVAPAFDRMGRRAAGDEMPVPLPWPSVADLVGGGLWPGVHFLVGGTGTGKSQWAMQAALHAARSQCPVLYIGLELGRDDLVARLASLAYEGRESWGRLYLGKAGAHPADRLANLAAVRDATARELRGLPLRLEMGGPYGWGYDLLRVRAEQMAEHYAGYVRKNGLAVRPFLVVLDFLQLVASPAPTEDRPPRAEDLRVRVQQAAYAARGVARDFDAAVLVVSSAARDKYAMLSLDSAAKGEGAEARKILQPPDFYVGCGKESGEIEYSADGCYVLVRQKPDAKQKAPDGVHFVCAKVRAGKAGSTFLGFDGTRFVEQGVCEGVMV